MGNGASVTGQGEIRKLGRDAAAHKEWIESGDHYALIGWELGVWGQGRAAIAA